MLQVSHCCKWVNVASESMLQVSQCCKWVNVASESMLQVSQCCKWVNAASKSMLQVSQCCKWVNVASDSMLQVNQCCCKARLSHFFHDLLHLLPGKSLSMLCALLWWYRVLAIILGLLWGVVSILRVLNIFVLYRSNLFNSCSNWVIDCKKFDFLASKIRSHEYNH